MRPRTNNSIVAVTVLAAWLCLTLCDPTDCSPPRSSLHRILQARTLEWVANSSSRGSSQPEMEPTPLASPTLAGGFFTTAPPGSSLPFKPRRLFSCVTGLDTQAQSKIIIKLCVCVFLMEEVEHSESNTSIKMKS